jgi:hypothetical protein
MSQRVDGDAGEGVQVAFAVDIPKPSTFTVGEGDGLPSIGVHQM